MKFPFRRLGALLAVSLLTGPLPGAQLACAAQERVTLQFQEVEIVELLKLLAEQAGFNLVASREVTGRTTLFLKDVDPWEALEVILASNGLAYERSGQIITIMSQREYELAHGMPYADKRVFRSMVLRHAKAADVARSLSQVKSNVGRVVADEASNTLILMDGPVLVEQMVKLAEQMDRPVETRIFSLNYSTAKALGAMLSDAVTKEVGKVSLDERSNQLAVRDYPERLDELEKMVRLFDQRASEVLIDAKILQINLSDQFQMGIDWSVLARENINIASPQTLNLTSGGLLQVAQAALSGEGDYSVLIEALRTFGDAKILSEPRLTVANNQEAKILVGTKEPYVTRAISQTGTGTAVTAETVTFIDVGIKMFVTPTIARDGFVQMKIRPEVSTKTGTLTTSENNRIPIIETAEAETVLVVQDGGTVILGGLIKDEDSLDEQRIPLLGDLPVLGIPFRSTQKTVRKTELVLFLTPHIVTGAKGESAFSKEVFLPESGVPYETVLLERTQAIVGIQSAVEKARGRVSVQFTLTPDGRVEGAPEVIQAGSEELRMLGRQAVFAAAPFPAFPPEMGSQPLLFTLDLNYE